MEKSDFCEKPKLKIGLEPFKLHVKVVHVQSSSIPPFEFIGSNDKIITIIQ